MMRDVTPEDQKHLRKLAASRTSRRWALALVPPLFVVAALLNLWVASETCAPHGVDGITDALVVVLDADDYNATYPGYVLYLQSRVDMSIVWLLAATAVLFFGLLHFRQEGLLLRCWHLIETPLTPLGTSADE